MGTNSRSQTWLCKKQFGSSMRTILAKVTTAAYPSSLHEEAGKAGVVPQLMDCQGSFPGDQYLVEMEYLDPQQGWVSLAAFVYANAAHKQRLRGDLFTLVAMLATLREKC